jgi:hypothetical protein
MEPLPTAPLLSSFTRWGATVGGGASYVKRHRPGCIRKATADEVANHGRGWRSRNRGREPMPTHYDKPTLEDLLYITLLCM